MKRVQTLNQHCILDVFTKKENQKNDNKQKG